MACPLNHNRWKGSGYTKEEKTTDELSEKMKRMMEERTKQDARLFPHNEPKKVETLLIVNKKTDVYSRSNS